MSRYPALAVGRLLDTVAAHQLPELLEPSQREAFTILMGHPVLQLQVRPADADDDGDDRDSARHLLVEAFNLYDRDHSGSICRDGRETETEG